MRYRTLHNMEKATKAIAAKGYDWDTANEIAMSCFYEAKRTGNSVEFFIEKIRNKGKSESYRGFYLRVCNDGKSYDILSEPHWYLMAIVGSLDKAKQWVDDWHKEHENQ